MVKPHPVPFEFPIGSAATAPDRTAPDTTAPDSTAPDSTGHAPAERIAVPDEGALLTENGSAQAIEWLGHEHRRLRRFPVQASRPIALRALEAQSAMVGRWLLVDILDISKGGMGLMVSDAHQFQAGQHLLLDVRSHPCFGLLRLEVEVRWCSYSFSFTTFGVSFLELLAKVPRLELERRTERRDPNDEAWAQE